MPTHTTGWWATLGRWCAMAFIVAGAARLGNMALTILYLNTEFPSPEWARTLTLTLAFGAAFFGLLGLYPRLANRTRRLSRVGIGAVAIAAGGLLVVTVGDLVGPANPPGALKFLPVLILVCSMLGFSLFGVASLRTDIPSRTVGALLLVAAISVVAFAGGITFTFVHSRTLALANSGAFAMALLATGYRIHAGPAPTGHADPTPDSVG